MENININKALTNNTAAIFEEISHLECIKNLYLCGGTAQSLQLFHRKSEDLDFELIDIRKDRPSLNMSEIIREISNKFPNIKRDIFDESHFELYVNNNKVKLSFFRPLNNVPYIHPGAKFNNIQTVSLQDLLGMKLYTIMQRNAHRDYYDIYCLLRAGGSLSEGVRYACNFSKHEIRSRSIYSTLLASNLFTKPEDFTLLEPRYDVSVEQIKKFIQETIEKETNLGEKAFDKTPDFFNTIIKERDKETLTLLGITNDDIAHLESTGYLKIGSHYAQLTHEYDKIIDPPVENTNMEFSFHDGTVFVLTPRKKMEIPLRQAIINSEDISQYTENPGKQQSQNTTIKQHKGQHPKP